MNHLKGTIIRLNFQKFFQIQENIFENQGVNHNVLIDLTALK